MPTQRCTPVILAILLPLLGVARLAAPFIATTATFVRLVPATISVDGVVVLRASTSDDDHPDVDEVWAYLRELRFDTTDEFAEFAAMAKDGALTLVGEVTPQAVRDGEPVEVASNTTSSRPLPRSVVLDVGYGGTVHLRELALVVDTPDRQGRTWQVAPSEIVRWFLRREITREEASRLKAPKRSR